MYGQSITLETELSEHKTNTEKSAEDKYPQEHRRQIRKSAQNQLSQEIRSKLQNNIN